MIKIEDILCRADRGVLSLTGSGGKTSIMFYLARQLAGAGKRVMSTTTTKIFYPSPVHSKTVLIDSDPGEIIKQAFALGDAAYHITAAAAHNADTGKLHGFPPGAVSLFLNSGIFDWILVEADGAAQRPVKAPAGHEPVIPPETGVHVAVAGLDAIGHPLSEELVFRSEIAGLLMGLTPGETVTAAAIARLLAHRFGAFKGAPPLAQRFIFLNKADTPELRACAATIADILDQKYPGTAEALITGQALDGVQVHSVHRLTAST